MGRKAKKWAVADCETDPFEWQVSVKPFVWGHYDGEVYREFRATEDFVAFVAERDEILYAHNGGRFDWLFLKQWFTPSKILLINGRLSRVELGHCELRDSWNILPVPLKSGGEKADFDYDKNRPENRDKHWAEISEYLRQDCVALYNLIAAFHTDHGQCITQASAALKSWRKISGLNPKFKRGAAGKRFREEMSPYYRGGRVDCLRGGIIDKPFAVWDINSAYPYAMTKPQAWGYSFELDDTIDDSRMDTGFFHVIADSAGGLGWNSDDGRLQWGAHSGEFHVTGHELRAGLDTGNVHIRDVIAAMYPEETITFTSYVEHYYGLKLHAEENGDTIARLLAKLLLNSLYGKWAADSSRYTQCEIVEGERIAELVAANEHVEPVGDLHVLMRPIPVPQQSYYNLATGAGITGYVRAMLMRAIAGAVNPIYCDTDSLAAESFSGECGDRLGQWTLEARCKRGGVAGRKLYAFEYSDQWRAGLQSKSEPGYEPPRYKTACKGVRLDGDEIMAIAAGGEISYRKPSEAMSFLNGSRFIERKVRNTACITA